MTTATGRVPRRVNGSSRAAAVALVVLAACSRTSPANHSVTSPAASSATSPGSQRMHLAVGAAGFSLPVALQREVAVAHGSTVLVAGGLDASGSSRDDVYRLSPRRGSLARDGAMPAAFHDAAAALLGGRLVVFGGGEASGTDLVQALGGSVIGRLPTRDSDLEAAKVGGEVVLVGGYDGTDFLTAVDATSDGVSFRRIATLPAGLRYAAVAAAGRDVIVAGGLTPAGPVAAILRIDVATGAVRRIGSLPRPLAHAAALTLGGDVYVLGGEDASGRTVRSVERVDPRTGRVASQHPLPGTVADAAGVALRPDRGLLIGGRRGPQGHDAPLAAILSLRLVP